MSKGGVSGCANQSTKSDFIEDVGKADQNNPRSEAASLYKYSTDYLNTMKKPEVKGKCFHIQDLMRIKSCSQRVKLINI